MPEYGMAIGTTGPKEMQPDQLLSVHRLLHRNFELSRDKIFQETGVWLGDTWEFKTAPPTQAYHMVLCPDCDGEEYCDSCYGSRYIAGEPIEGVFVHHFAWYVNLPNDLAGWKTTPPPAT